jgi:hypothetical protein
MPLLAALLLIAGLGVTAMITFQGADHTPPKWSDLAEDKDKLEAGEIIVLSATWSDETALDRVTLNVSLQPGKWTETGTQLLNGKQALALFRYTVPNLTPGTVIKWKMRAQDTAGNRAETPVLNFTIADLTTPTWSDPVWQKVVDIGQANQLEVRLADNFQLSLATFQVNESGQFASVRNYRLTTKDALVSFSWTNITPITPDTTIEWRVMFKDTWNNTNLTDTFSFKVSGCPVCPDPTDWSECAATKKGGQQARAEFVCGPETNYQCQSQEETRECQLGVTRAQAEQAIATAKSAVEVAQADGKDVTEAKGKLDGAQRLYTNGQWSDVLVAAHEAEQLAALAQPPPPPPGPNWVLIAVVLVLVIAAAAILQRYDGKLLQRYVDRLMPKGKKKKEEQEPDQEQQYK